MRKMKLHSLQPLPDNKLKLLPLNKLPLWKHWNKL
jgi:hypothetical protein